MASAAVETLLILGLEMVNCIRTCRLQLTALGLGLFWASTALAQPMEIELLALDEDGQRAALRRDGEVLILSAGMETDDLRFNPSEGGALFELRLDSGERIGFRLQPGESRKLDRAAVHKEATPILTPIKKKAGVE